MNKSRQLQNLIKRLARQHVKPLGKRVKIVNCRRYDDWTFEVTFKYDGITETQLVGSQPCQLSLESSLLPKRGFAQTAAQTTDLHKPKAVCTNRRWQSHFPNTILTGFLSR